MNRREFILAAGAGAAAGILSSSTAEAVESGESTQVKGRFRRAAKLHMVDPGMSVADKFQLLRDIGYDGVESRTPDDGELQDLLDARDSTGLPVHGLIHPDPDLASTEADARSAAVDRLREAIRKAQTLDATTVLVVPAEVTAESSYVDTYRQSQTSLREVLPTAREHEVRIALENVTNQFLYSPMEFARYIDELDSSWVGAYFDTGNVIGFGYPHDWIRTLGERIIKLDIKDRYWGDAGRELNLGEGDVDWTAVRTALDEIGFEGWATAEVRGGDRQRLTQVHQLMGEVLGIDG